MERIVIRGDVGKAIDDYAFYVHHGGEDLYGEFNEQNFKRLKETQEKTKKTALYTSWRNPEGKDCKTIGPVTKCFCNHRYREHNYQNPDTKNGRKIKCKAPKCKCVHFTYVPVHGSQDFRCSGCKHSHTDHDPKKMNCLKCSKCPKFTSRWSCFCGYYFADHKTVGERREERIVQGKFVSEAEGILMDAFLVGELKKPMNMMRVPNKAVMMYGNEGIPVQEKSTNKMLEDEPFINQNHGANIIDLHSKEKKSSEENKRGSNAFKGKGTKIGGKPLLKKGSTVSGKESTKKVQKKNTLKGLNERMKKLSLNGKGLK